MSSGRAGRVVGPLAAAAFSLPLLVLVIQAFADSWRAPALLPDDWGLRGFDTAFASGAAGEALATSLGVAVATTALALLVAWPAARVLGERRLARPGPVVLLLALPLLVPPFAAGFGLTEWFIRTRLDGTLPGIVAVHALLALPYAIGVLAAGFGRELAQLEEMARACGGSPLRRWWLVTMPSLAPTLATAGLLAFLVSWSQYGSSLAVGAGRPLLPLVMFPFVRDDPQVASAFALLFLVPAVLVLGAAARAGRKPL